MRTPITVDAETSAEQNTKDEQFTQRFKSLGHNDTTSLYFGLMQISHGIELISDMMYNFPSEYVEDSWTIARDRMERFIDSFFDSYECGETFNLKAIDTATSHLNKIWSNTGKKNAILKLLQEIRMEAINEKWENKQD